MGFHITPDLTPDMIATMDQNIAIGDEIIDELMQLLRLHRAEKGHQCTIKVCVPQEFAELVLEMPDDMCKGIMHLALLRLVEIAETEEP